MERELIINLSLNRSQADQQARQFADGERERIRRHLTDFEVAERAKAQIIARSNSQRVAAEVRATDASKQGWGISQQGIESAAKAVSGFAVQMAGLQSLQGVVGTFADHFQRLKLETMDAVKFAQGYKEALRELAALKGQLGDTDKTLAQDVAFRAKTLQSASASRAFQEAALGAGESAIDKGGTQKLISQAEFDKLMEFTGKFQATEGGSPGSHGTLAGQIPALMGKRVTAGEAFAKQQQLFSIFQPGGADFSSMTDQYLQQAPLVTGGIFRDPADMAALLSAFSTTNKGGAGTNVQQFTRATVGGLGRMRGANIEGLVEKQGEYLKGLGADNQMDPIQIGELISGDFSAQEKLATEKGKTFNALDYAKTHGFSNQEDIMSLIAFHGFNKNETWQKTFKPLAGQVPDEADALAKLDAAQQTPDFERTKVAMQEEFAKLKRAGSAEGTLDTMYRGAFHRLKGDKENEGDFESTMSSSWWNSTKELAFGEQGATRLEAQRALGGEARRLGIDPKIDFRTDAKTGARTEEFMGEDRMVELANRVRAKGGDISPGIQELSATITAQHETQKAILDELRKQNKFSAPPLQAKPVVQTR